GARCLGGFSSFRSPAERLLPVGLDVTSPRPPPGLTERRHFRDGTRGSFMGTLTLRRIRYGDRNAPEQLAALRSQLSLHGEVVSPRGRELTQKVFGEALPPVRVAER